jgi:hypothetical protein
MSIAEPEIVLNSVNVVKNNLKQLLQRDLTLPPYQRRYCWAEEQVALLLTDIDRLLTEDSEGAQIVPLFLGTVILHEQKVNEIPHYDLVDGQQRSLTINLLIIALQQYNENRDETVDVYSLLNGNKPSLLKATFTHRDAQQQLASNFKQIKDFIQNKSWAYDLGKITYLLENLEFVVITIHSIDQAFAFFDSQNSSGKRLSEFDLLKARHLRGIVSDPSVGIGCSRIWEEYENQKLSGCYSQSIAYYLTEQLLARTRQRQRGKHVDALRLETEYPVLTRKHNTVDRSIVVKNPSSVSLSPHSNSALYRDWQVSYNASEKVNFPLSFSTELQLSGDSKLTYVVNDVIELPLQLNQPLIGGEQFFIYVGKYVELYKRLFPSDVALEKDAAEIEITELENNFSTQERLLKQHRSLESRQGLGYPRLIQSWQALVVFYVDRFGEDENFDYFVRLSDQYIFSLRILLHQVKRSSVEKKLLEADVFPQLLGLATSGEALALIIKLVEARGCEQELANRLNDDVVGVRKSYVDKFYWHEDQSKENHHSLDNSLSRLLAQHKPVKAESSKEALSV